MFWKFVLAAMLTIIPQNNIHVNVEKEKPRLVEFSKAIATAIDNNPNLYKGPAAKYAAATNLVAIAWHESGFSKEIQYCHKKGDRGKSITNFQMMKPWALSRRVKQTYYYKVNGKTRSYDVWRWKQVHTEQEVCNDPFLAAKHALYLFTLLQEQCPISSPYGWYAAYGTGYCSKRLPATDGLCLMWERLSKKMGLKGAICGKNIEISVGNKEELDKLVDRITSEY